MTPLDRNLATALRDLGIEENAFNYRHPSTFHMLKALAPNPNLPDHLHKIAVCVFSLGLDFVTDFKDGPELTAGLRKLLEAKDCFVRAALDSETPVDYRDR